LEIVYTHSEGELANWIGRSWADCIVLPACADVEIDGITIARQIRDKDRDCPILLFHRGITVESAVEAMRAGVSDLLDTAVAADQIVATLENICGRSPWARAGCTCLPLAGTERMVGQGRAMEEVRRRLTKVAATEANVLITGETGTGKELVAELIHRNSRHREGRFVSVNCAAIPDALLESELFGHEQGAFTGAHTAREGKLQHASGGTLFLDEVGDMSLPSQAKVLRAIETRTVQKLGSNALTPIQVRLIAATNQDLEQLATEKLFRRDLYYRLNVVRLHLPPLRERQEDIPELTEHILREVAGQHQTPVRRLAGEVLERLCMHTWPGNIRELRNVIESMVVFASSRNVNLADLPLYLREDVRASVQQTQEERSKIISALCSSDWNRSTAAKLLCCSRMTLYRKMVKYHISAHS
jgi:DNA-binding NtrC family response regulator